MDTVFEFFTYDNISNSYTIEGYHLLYGIEEETVEPYLMVNDKSVQSDFVKRCKENIELCGDGTARIVGFKSTFSGDKSEMEIRPVVKAGNVIVESSNIHSGFFFPVSCIYQNSYANIGCHTVNFDKGSIRLTLRGGFVSCFLREWKFLQEVWK